MKKKLSVKKNVKKAPRTKAVTKQQPVLSFRTHLALGQNFISKCIGLVAVLTAVLVIAKVSSMIAEPLGGIVVSRLKETYHQAIAAEAKAALPKPPVETEIVFGGKR